ncbi:MAG: FecR domain-containing protein [Alphaproteobacteria bacterium]|nr:FecR domain-containing protein [Alphaproteobacteria bacterium]
MSSSSTGGLQDRILALYGIRDWPFASKKASGSRAGSARKASGAASSGASAGRLLGHAGVRRAFIGVAVIFALFIALPFVWDSLESTNGSGWLFTHPTVVTSADTPVTGLRSTQTVGVPAAKRWAARNFSGDVLIQTAGGIWRPMTKRHGIVPGTRIETGKTGRIVLRQKGDVVTVMPNSRFEVPKTGKNNVRLSFGKVLFDMERRPDRRFSVGTTHLVAVVKGTNFTVEADNGASTVHLTRGSVEITALKNGRTPGETHLMEPGQIAVASKAGNGKLTIINRKSWKAQ